MTIKRNNTTTNNTTTKAPVARKATKAPVATKAPAPARKAPAPKAPTYMTIAEGAALASMVRGLNERIEALETQAQANERAIVALQTLALEASRTQAPAPVATKAPAPKASPVASDDLEALLDTALDSVIEGMNASPVRFAEKVIPQVPNDLRAYATQAVRKQIKAYREANGMTLVALSQALVDKFEAECGPVTEALAQLG
jgi:hypothetical protein